MSAITREVFFILIGLLSIFLLITPVMGEDGPNIEWQRCVGDTGITSCSEIITTADNGVLIIGNEIMKIFQNGTIAWKRTADVRDVYQDESGSIFLCGSKQDDLWIEKIDLNGVIQWSKLYDGSGNAEKDYGQTIKPTPDGNFIIQGYSGYNASSMDLSYNWYYYTAYSPWPIKIDSNGNLLWEKGYPGEIIVAPDGSFFTLNMVSMKNSSGFEQSNITVNKISSSGNPLWQDYRSYGGTDAEGDALLKPLNGGFVIASWTRSNDGNVSGNHGGNDIWVMIADGEGNILNQRCYGGTGSEYPSKLFVLDNGNIVIIGQTTSMDGDLYGINNIEGGQTWILQIDQSGNILQNKVYSLGDIREVIQLTDEGDYIFSSMTDPTLPSNSCDFLLTHIYADGSLDWQKFYGGTGYEQAKSFSQTNDGYFYIAGTTTSNDGDVGWYHGNGNNDLWIAKLSDRQSPLPLLLSSTPDYANSFKGDPVIISALGTGLSPNAQISLIHEEGASVDATSVSSVSHDELSASFNLEGMPGGFYDIALTNPDGGSSSLNSVFRYIVFEDVESEWKNDSISGIIASIGSRGPSITVDNENNPHIVYTLDQKTLNYTF